MARDSREREERGGQGSAESGEGYRGAGKNRAAAGLSRRSAVSSTGDRSAVYDGRLLADGGTDEEGAESAEDAAGESGSESGGSLDARRSGADSPDDTGSTSDVRQRWWLTNDVISVAAVFSFVGLVGAHGYGAIDLATLPTEVTYAWIGVVLASATWALGVDLAEKWGGVGGDE